MNEEHALARVGKLTASRFPDAVAKTKTGWGASRERYKGELVAERMTGLPYEQYRSAAMERGNDMEPRARAAYAFRRDVNVELVGFVPHPTIEMAGCSPDGLIGSDGLVEFKCPDTHTHLNTRIGRLKIDNDYMLQMYWQMACTGRQWCDFVSFDDRVPRYAQLYIKRIHRLQEQIDLMEDQARIFLAEVEADFIAQQQIGEAA
jgi:hypothetical protein